VKRIIAGVVPISVVVFACLAQEPTVQPFTGEEIAAMQPALKASADAGNGTATRLLVQQPDFYSSLIFRDKSGEVEIHQNFDEVMVVLEGNATVKTGGTAQNVSTLRPGELRGSSATGATSHALSKGAVVHIEANTPHQVFMPPDGHVLYIDVKIKHPVDSSRTPKP
jgi:mannose-6-phosphate isomerase-like protein (cupin superfamily)